MKILITGSSGLVGGALISETMTKGHAIKKLVRRQPQSSEEVLWDPGTGRLDRNSLEGLDAVVHLAGESIAEGRWNAARKIKIKESRIQGTRLLCESLAQLSHRPKVLVCASASGYYGNREAEILREDSPCGTGFLAEVCREWEQAAGTAAEHGIRVVHLRFGIILTPKGGALRRMLPPFRMGLGGPLGSGLQYWSWLSLDDTIGMIQHAIDCDALQGPVNAVTPNPVTNAEFTRILAKVLRRPALFPVPAFVLRIALGEMADELLLPSFRMEPSKLLSTNYPFRHPDLEGALRYLT